MEARAITGAEFEHALEKAEHLLQTLDRNTARVRTAHMVLSTVLFSMAFSLSVLLQGGQGYVAVPVSFVGVVAAGYLWFGHVVKLRTEVRRDERAMFEMIDILRELLLDVAEKEHWGPARYKMTVSRVSRFPVGRRGSR